MPAAVPPPAPAARPRPSPPGYIPAVDCRRRYPELTRAKLYRLCVGDGLRAIVPEGAAPCYNVDDLDRIMAGRRA